MVLIINGTNRQESLSKPVSDYAMEYLRSIQKDEVKLLDLCTLRMTAFEASSMYSKEKVTDEILELKQNLMDPCNKMVFVSPEYNGSFPGILKLFIDACSVNEAKKAFYHKKALLIGTASGRAGNLRGLDHLTSVLMYMNMIIYPNRLPISRIESLMDDSRHLMDQDTKIILNKLLDEFILF